MARRRSRSGWTDAWADRLGVLETKMVDQPTKIRTPRSLFALHILRSSALFYQIGTVACRMARSFIAHRCDIALCDCPRKRPRVSGAS